LQNEQGRTTSGCFLVLGVASFVLAILITLLFVLIRLPSHEEQVKMKKMLKHERTESIKRIASQMVALPVAQTRNTVVRGAKTKKFENNLY